MKIIFCLFLTYLTVFAQNLTKYSHIKNEKDEIIVLEINNRDIDDFLSDIRKTETKEPGENNLRFNLRILSISKNSFSVNEDETWFKFIQENAPNLEKVIFTDFGRSGEAENLISFLESFKGIKIKSFEWSNQREITDKSEIEKIASYEDFWNNLEELSFKMKELVYDNFLISSLNLKNLKRLNLSDTELNQFSLQKLIDHADNMPKLNTLIIDDNPRLITARSKGNIASLKHLSILQEDDLDFNEYNTYIIKNSSLIKDLDAFFLNTEYLLDAEYGPFKFDEQGQIPIFQSIIQKVIYRNTNAKNVGYFYRDITNVDNSKNNSFSAQALVVITEDDLKIYTKAFTDSIQDFVQILGHELAFNKIVTFLKSKSFNQILFIDSHINRNQRDFIRTNFPNSSISYIDNAFNFDPKNDISFIDRDRPFLRDLNYLFKSMKKASKSSRRN